MIRNTDTQSHRGTKKFALLFFCAALLPLRMASQTQKTSDGQFTLKTGTEVVLVNVTVRDKSDNFVKDLKAQDFTILEDGKKQDVISIDVENTDSVVGAESPTAPVLGTLNTAPNAPPPP